MGPSKLTLFARPRVQGGCLHLTCKTAGGRNGCGYEFCWRCGRKWDRTTHPDFFKCSLPVDTTARGAKGEFEVYDKRATGYVAEIARLKDLQAQLAGEAVRASKAKGTSTQRASQRALRLRALELLLQCYAALYSTNVSRYFVPKRLRSVHRRLLFETHGLRRALAGLRRRIMPTVAAHDYPPITNKTVLQMAGLKSRLASFREEVTPLIATAVESSETGPDDVPPEEKKPAVETKEGEGEGEDDDGDDDEFEDDDEDDEETDEDDGQGDDDEQDEDEEEER
jgi:hypothetical protein